MNNINTKCVAVPVTRRPCCIFAVGHQENNEQHLHLRQQPIFHIACGCSFIDKIGAHSQVLATAMAKSRLFLPRARRNNTVAATIWLNVDNTRFFHLQLVKIIKNGKRAPV